MIRSVFGTMQWCMHGEQQESGPIADSYLVKNLKYFTACSYFERQHQHKLPRIGFYLGMYHGGVLSPTTGQLRPDVTTLATFHSQDAARAYSVGRKWFFTEAEEHERRYTEGSLIAQLRECTCEMVEYDEPDEIWFYTIGGLLGHLSGHLFPLTELDRQMWATIFHQYKRTNNKNTRPRRLHP